MSDTMRAREMATAVLGWDPGPMAAIASLSHQVHIGAEVVVKIIDSARHTRLTREIALAPHLPAGITAPLLASGTHPFDGGEALLACYARVPGTTPGQGLPEADERTARILAEQAVERLRRLHDWIPAASAVPVLREPLDHGGFTGRAGLLAEVGALTGSVVPAGLVDGLTALAAGAPERSGAHIPVHADCHWGNWLATGATVTVLLDFEWARFGDPLDDWFFLIADSGRHRRAVLAVVSEATGLSPDELTAACEIRHANYLAADIRLALSDPAAHGALLAPRLDQLSEVIGCRTWWKSSVD
ncbi:phosphotransferase family protein [Actinoplanes subglobosus]|uniref:Phosphotransferase family protein n=1 Tax=Actinoplanes subglobosus TaxID=1547892 RepID=A0ABV8J8W3_9ACTN